MSVEKLPEGWLLSKFTELMDVQGGTQPPKSEFIAEEKEGYIRLLQIRDFGKKPVPTYIPETKKLKTCREEDLLIGRYGASLGRICTGHEGAYNVALAKVIFPQEFERSYIRYYLESEIFQFPLRLLSRSAQNGFNKEDLGRFDFLLVPLAEQKIIAEKLDTLLTHVDSTKASLEKIPKILNRFRQAVLVTALSIANGKSRDFDRIVKLIDVAEKITDGEHITPKTVDAGIPLLSAKDVQENELLFDNVKYLSNATAEKALSRCSPGKDDILIVSRGATVGRTHLVSTNAKFCLMGSVLLIKLNKNLVLPRFMELVFKNISGQRQLVSASGATAQQAIYIRDVKEFSFNLLSLDEQREIVRRVEQLFSYADTIEKQVNNALARVNNLTQSILAKAFRGELTAQWRAENPELISGDNSAAALLEKIKAERAASTGKKASRKKS